MDHPPQSNGKDQPEHGPPIKKPSHLHPPQVRCCEERSDEAISYLFADYLRLLRHDALGVIPRNDELTLSPKSRQLESVCIRFDDVMRHPRHAK